MFTIRSVSEKLPVPGGRAIEIFYVERVYVSERYQGRTFESQDAADRAMLLECYGWPLHLVEIAIKKDGRYDYEATKKAYEQRLAVQAT